MSAGLKDQRALVHVLADEHFLIRCPVDTRWNDGDRRRQSRLVDKSLSQSVNIGSFRSGATVQPFCGPIGIPATLKIPLRVAEGRIVGKRAVNPGVIGQAVIYATGIIFHNLVGIGIPDRPPIGVQAVQDSRGAAAEHMCAACDRGFRRVDHDRFIPRGFGAGTRGTHTDDDGRRSFQRPGSPIRHRPKPQLPPVRHLAGEDALELQAREPIDLAVRRCTCRC